MHRTHTAGLRTLLVAAAVAVAACSPATEGGDPRIDDPPAPLEGTRWRPVELGGREVPRTAPGDPFLRLDPGTRRLAASAGCNHIGGVYTLDGDALRVDSLVSTLMLCADGDVARWEEGLLRALERVRGWEVEGERLALKAGDAVLARFVAESP
jgi:heat shock protein HslJ